jgi:LuxR family maltose regulon positive regulatory protein
LAIQHRLAVVTGPPGAGKTTSVADWARNGFDGRVAWVALEEADNEPRRFSTSITSALSSERSKGEVTGYRGCSDGGLWDDGSTANHVPGPPQVLVLDDFHLITNKTVIESVSHLIERAPSNLRLVLIGQRAPAFSFQRLLAREEATTVAGRELRFTVEECGALIALTAGKFVSLDELELLTERSEGWAAGLHLVALALSGHEAPSEFVRGFSGVFGPVAEYLEHEVLLRQDPALIRFLLQTSVLDNLSAGLCGAITGRDDAGEILGYLVENNLFVLPAGSVDGVYRYHRLFADLLRSRLQREGPTVAREANFDAANWFEQSGDPRSAAQYFVRAKAYDRALSVLFAELDQVGEAGVLDGGAALLPVTPGTEVEGTPGCIYIAAAAELGHGQVSGAARLLQRLQHATAEDPDRELWRNRADFLWALYADRVADAASVLDHARAAANRARPISEAVPEPNGADAKGTSPNALDVAISAHLPVLTARAHLRLGQLDEAQAVLANRFPTWEVVEASQPAMLAMVACAQGRLKDAYRLASVTLRRSEEQAVPELDAFESRLVLAEVLFEQNELEMARGQLEAALRLCRSPVAGTHWSWAVEIELVRVLTAQHCAHEALKLLGRLRRVGLRNPPPHYLLKKLNDSEVGCQLSLGDLEGALAVARSVHTGDISDEMSARTDLASGRPDRAFDRLSSSRSPHLANEIRRLVLLASTERQRGRTLQAENAVRRAVAASREEGFVRPFVEAAPQILPPLRVIFAVGPDPYLSQLIAEVEHGGPVASPDLTNTIIEPLTAREREVLGYLSSHLSGRQIAGRIYVSANTVKSHQKAIYRKLGATSRAEAVAAAISCGLL